MISEAQAYGTFYVLPYDTKFEIFKNLNHHEILNLRRINTIFKSLLEDYEIKHSGIRSYFKDHISCINLRLRIFRNLTKGNYVLRKLEAGCNLFAPSSMSFSIQDLDGSVRIRGNQIHIFKTIGERPSEIVINPVVNGTTIAVIDDLYLLKGGMMLFIGDGIPHLYNYLENKEIRSFWTFQNVRKLELSPQSASFTCHDIRKIVKVVNFESPKATKKWDDIIYSYKVMRVARKFFYSLEQGFKTMAKKVYEDWKYFFRSSGPVLIVSASIFLISLACSSLVVIGMEVAGATVIAMIHVLALTTLSQFVLNCCLFMLSFSASIGAISFIKGFKNALEEYEVQNCTLRQSFS